MPTKTTFTENRQSPTKSRFVRRCIHGSLVLGSCTMAWSCSAGPDVAVGSPSPSGGESVAHTEQALDYCPNPVDCTSVTTLQAMTDTSGSAGHLIKVAKDFGSEVENLSKQNYFKFSTDVLQTAFDIYSASPDLLAGIMCLNQEIACIAQGLDWQIKASAWGTQYSQVATALMDIPTGFATGSPDDHDSHEATLESGGINMFARTYVANSTDGDGKWKSIIGNSSPPQIASGNVFDWEAGFTRFMSLIPRRIMILGYLDPQFATNGLRNSELEGAGSDPFTDPDPGYRHILQQRLKQMIDGVRCDTKDHWSGISDGTTRTVTFSYDHTDVACADVNTGISAESTYVIPNFTSCIRLQIPGTAHVDPACLASLPGESQVIALKDTLYRQVLGKLPVFEVNSMIDSLRRLSHPWIPDLAQGQGRIPLSANLGLCLDLPAANSTSGTAIQIWGCNGTAAQQWSYDRAAGTIKNTAVNKCLQVRPSLSLSWPVKLVIDNRGNNAQVEISDCESPVPLRQQWTYDQEHGTVRSALGTVLTVQYNIQQPGQPVVTYDYRGGAAQQWYSDRDSGYCQNICEPHCQAACADAGPGTGSCVGSCMGGCVSSCPSREP